MYTSTINLLKIYINYLCHLFNNDGSIKPWTGIKTVCVLDDKVGFENNQITQAFSKPCRVTSDNIRLIQSHHLPKISFCWNKLYSKEI